MTYRRVVSYGLIAGLRTEEINRMRPGEVLDLYAYRLEYDAQLAGSGRTV
jgi:hypothetical protein